jgi:hypothetical protein
MNLLWKAGFVIVTMGLLSSGCVTRESISPEESAVPAEISTATNLPPSETMIAGDPTPTPEPIPSVTNTPKPTVGLGENFVQITYRTLGELEPLFQVPVEDVTELEFSPDHRYLRLRQEMEDSAIDIFLDLEKGEDIFSIAEGQRTYFNPDSSNIAVLDDSGVTIVDLVSQETRKIYNSTYSAGALSPDGRTLVELEVIEGQIPSTTLHIMDLTQQEEKYQIYINALVMKETIEFDLDGRLLCASYLVPPATYVSAVWRVDNGLPVYTIYGYDEITLHPFGSEVALSHAKRDTISLVSTVTWQQKLYLGSDQEGPGYSQVSYAAEGRLIYALNDKEISAPQFWFPPSGEELDFGEDLDLLALTISPDRELLAASDKQGHVTIWGIPE